MLYLILSTYIISYQLISSYFIYSYLISPHLVSHYSDVITSTMASQIDCLLNRLFMRRSKKTSKLRVTGLCAGSSPVTAQRASNAENSSIWWRHHDLIPLVSSSVVLSYVCLRYKQWQLLKRAIRKTVMSMTIKRRTILRYDDPSMMTWSYDNAYHTTGPL